MSRGDGRGQGLRQDSESQVGQLYTAARAVLVPIFRFCWRIKVAGLEHLPDQGGAILCPNHTSVIDSFFLPAVLPRRITFVGKSEYLDSWKTRRLFPALGMIPLDRAGGSASERALNTAARVLEQGDLFGIYPEGTRSRDGVLHRGHTGPARLALRTGVPIIPVGIRGTREIQPPEAKFPRVFRTCSIRIGRPVEVSRYRDRASDRLVLRQIIDEVMFEIRELSGQSYLDTYATKKADDIPTETAVIPSGGNGAEHPTGNGAGNGSAPRRSSAEVLKAAGAGAGHR